MDSVVRRCTALVVGIYLAVSTVQAQPISLLSPDGSAEATLSAAPAIGLRIRVDGLDVDYVQRDDQAMVNW